MINKKVGIIMIDTVYLNPVG